MTYGAAEPKCKRCDDTFWVLSATTIGPRNVATPRTCAPARDKQTDVMSKTLVTKLDLFLSANG
jgi:hypothetical protein